MNACIPNLRSTLFQVVSRLRHFLALLVLVAGTPAYATLDPAQTALCYNAINSASASFGTPREVMLAISLTETGKKIAGRIQPWPWTVNMEGKGFWFDTRAEALAYVRKRHAEGARSFDVGCFQINYKWHHQHFRSIEDMFDPKINASYAARFLNTLFNEKGNWSAAAGAYHSRTPSFAKRYSARFDRYIARIAGKTLDDMNELGHGSETLRTAALEGDPKEPEPVRQYEGVDLGRVRPPTSSGTRPLASLAATGSNEGGLLRRSAGSLF